jgi:polysaccharide biosynthesis/export protein
MVRGPSVALLRDIQTLYDAGTVAGLSDRELLERFTRARDGSSEAAFEVLVRRHGPMVLRVCRGALKDWNDAEDAFQATFIILARRCGSIRRRDSVESWLFGVACRVAARARVEAARRRVVEERGATEAEAALGTTQDDDADRLELGPIVQEEVRRLPEKYRAAVVLCYWEGLTQEQAAAQLGIPLGTVRSRLARARDLLRRRLTRRGAAPLAGIMASGLDFTSIMPIPAAVPDSWVAATVKAVSSIAAGGGPATAGAASASVALLVRGVMRSMVMMKLKTIAISLSLIAVGAAGVIVAAPQARQIRPEPAASRGPRIDKARNVDPTTRADGRKVQPTLKPLENYVIEPPDLLIVEVLEALPGRPISGERLVRPDGKISLGFYGEIYVAGLTIPEAKEKIVLHLRKYIADHILGLSEDDPQSGEAKPDPDGQIALKHLRDTDRVFVNVTAYNSQNYYIQGAVRIPGKLPITGNDTVLDALEYAGGLNPQADHNNVVLYRKEKNGTLKRLPINVDQIMMGDDPTTNYQLLPGDRLVIPFKPGASQDEEESSEERPARTLPRPPATETPQRAERRAPADRSEPTEDRVRAPRLYFDRDADARPLIRIERRLSEVERKLDRVLEALERRAVLEPGER